MFSAKKKLAHSLSSWGFELVLLGNNLSDCRLITHCGLVMEYGDMDLGQHWLR